MEATQNKFLKNNKLINARRIFNKRKMIELTSNFFCHIIIIGIIFLILYPFIEKALTTFLPYEDLADKTVKYIPKSFGSENLNTLRWAIGIMDYWKSLSNTAVLCLLTALIQVMVCTFVAYGFARFKFPGRGLLFATVIIVLMIPPQVIMTSLYMKFSFFNLLGLPTLFTGGTINITEGMWPFVLMSVFAIGFKNSLYIYMLNQFFRGLPTEIEEAGMIDGSNHFGIFFRLMLPNAIPMMVTVFLFAFSWQWTDNYYTSLFLANSDFKVLTIQLTEIGSYPGSEVYFTPVFKSALNGTGILLVIIPLVILYLFGQKFFVQGVSQSGIVGQ